MANEAISGGRCSFPQSTFEAGKNMGCYPETFVHVFCEPESFKLSQKMLHKWQAIALKIAQRCNEAKIKNSGSQNTWGVPVGRHFTPEGYG
jgi:hypothetical protein